MQLNVTESTSVWIPKEKSTSNTFLFQHITTIYHKSAGLQVCRSASLQSAFVAHRSTVHKLAVYDGHARSKFTSESPLPHREQTPVFCALSKCGDIELPILQKKDGSFVKINTNFRLIIKVFSPYL